MGFLEGSTHLSPSRSEKSAKSQLTGRILVAYGARGKTEEKGC